jgi:shikimate dehydrogenase
MNVQQAISWQTKSKLFVSLAAKPGKTGETFYNTLFKHHNIDAEYVACECTDLASDMQLVRQHCAGASITMPYKNQVQKYLDKSNANFMPINTVVNQAGVLTGYNCDYLGLQDILQDSVKDKSVVILGDGAMADNASLLCVDAANVKIFSRRKDNWIYRHSKCDVLINSTSIGMGTEETPVDKITANLVIDCVIGNTKLIRHALDAGRQIITGAEIYIAQFQHQFRLYTEQDADQDVLKLVVKKVFDV